ncbi:hypothetical protein GCM10010149_47580 [Nonomuraea roseoviolacea subsp. roseoviolacea]|uniref:siphovirus ReqiPepy6 Gp37-like family protein n=1 Tax=Nonomuraea roseoviolacea TaxID=103837 RepID=UPI0031DECFA8
MPKFLIEARDANLRRIGIIEQYTRLDVIARHCDVGSWLLELPGDYTGALLQPGCGVIIWVAGLDEPIMSGPVTEIQRKWDADAPGAGVLVINGVSDELLLWGRVTYPQPDRSIYLQDLDAARGRAPVGQVITDLVNLNAGPGARANRRVPGLVVTPSTAGRDITWYSRFDYVGAKAKELAQATGLGWQVRQGQSGQVVFSVYTPRDLSSLVVFSRDAGNLAAYSYSLKAPTATRFLAAAQGEGKLRYLRAYRSDDAGVMEDPSEVSGVYDAPLDRWTNYWPERFIDRRDIPLAYDAMRRVINAETGEQAHEGDFVALNDAVAEDAPEHAPVAVLSLSPVDLPSLQFGRHYRLGDTVSVQVDGETITDVLREVRLSDGDDGPKVTPIVGSSFASETPLIYRQIRRMWDSLRKLEARR